MAEDKKKRAFKITLSDKTVRTGNLGEEEDIPEDVVEYLTELGRQMEEAGDSAMTLDSGMLPERVRKALLQAVAGAHEKMAEDLQHPKKLHIRELSPDMLAEMMDEKIPFVVETLGGGYDFAEPVAGILAMAWEALVRKDEDWGELTAEHALNLYAGVIMAVFTAFRYVEKRAKGEEAGDDEADAE